MADDDNTFVVPSDEEGQKQKPENAGQSPASQGAAGSSDDSAAQGDGSVPTPPTPPAPPTPPSPPTPPAQDDTSAPPTPPTPPATKDEGAAQTGFADFKKEEESKEPFNPATPVTGTLKMSEEEILQGDKNIFGRPIAFSGGKPKDAKGQFEAIINAKIPEHSLKIDEKEFLELLAGSISLLFEEKLEIINSISKLKQEQIDKLLDILKDEKKKFQELVEKHQKEMVEKKGEKMQEEREEAQEFLAKEEGTKGDDLSAAEDLLKGLE